MPSQPCEICGEPTKGQLCPECYATEMEKYYDAQKENEDAA